MLIKKGAKLTDSDVWDIFKANIRGTDNPYFQELVKNYDVFVKALGKEVVDNKLYMETASNRNQFIVSGMLQMDLVMKKFYEYYEDK